MIKVRSKELKRKNPVKLNLKGLEFYYQRLDHKLQ
jgi:hypothetical protein